ncbi:hypothetical protein PR048_019785 [Dryococelus australis]|uniref:THAP-type domain-containing protein n=1 Tax=Dryococelus australis TaxID=614101 RepID=A0ABQ9H4G2_9NEOP|nr:hypothetical protein PR048_019785 [Dryococelus australis]
MNFYQPSHWKCSSREEKKYEDKVDVNWLSIQWLRYEISTPFKMFCKEHFQDFVDFSVLDIKPIRKGKLIRSLCCIPKLKLYDKPRAITKMRRKDMVGLLPLILPVYHTFFLNLNITEVETESDMPDLE